MKRFIIAAIALLMCAGMCAQEFSLSTNVLDYAQLGTLNLEASYGIARHWSLSAGLKYNPFTFREGEDAVQSRQRSVSVGTRFWPWHIFSGWWLSGGVRYQEYNQGGIVSARTSEGDRVGGSLGGGYSIMLTPHLNLDIGAGVWAGYDIYTTYACQSCGKKIDEGGKYFILPADMMLAFTFIF